LNLRWDVSDPNDDELNFLVQIRKEGWPSWIALTETPVTEKTYAWDTTPNFSPTFEVLTLSGTKGKANVDFDHYEM
jgi:hypothetical protein